MPLPASRSLEEENSKRSRAFEAPPVHHRSSSFSSFIFMTMNLFHQFQIRPSISNSSIFSNPLINQSHSFLRVSVTTCLRRKTIQMAIPVPARDRVIDFGKYKGKMLGTLPSSYLKWVSKNLRARDFEEWAKLADQVLGDPIYRDRIEWEFAQNVLNGNQLNFKSLSFSRPAAVSELMEISERFGWDNQDKAGWSKIDFHLLGTSKGGRIPRLKHKDPAFPFRFEVQPVSDQGGAEAKSRRMERRERQKTMRLRRQAQEPQPQTVCHSGLKEKSRGSFVNEQEEKKNLNMDDDDGEDAAMGQNGIRNPFPGRQALLQKAINRTRTFLS